ncbi:hypothetical protein VHEMI08530 [[Torrubiella] hemipterigena]|uniref:BAG domain-containing protein n=1 Tax=[Torrubiella] hemipterigena TaxID=1531966 RepID=A0A0A1TNM3_9HYPO|nr:hypothetical protein VHEMI08530 [[Torrubiella] hemipterigena]
MSRYGWSLHREGSSPYTSMRGGVPTVTEDDFSYITSQDLDDVRHSRRTHRDESDDVLIIKNQGVTYPAHFPPYAIGDGKLLVKDVKHRIGLLMGLSDRRTHRIKLLYKGRQLKDPEATVREYGIKNKSELMAVVPEEERLAPADLDDTIIVSEEETRAQKRKNKKKSHNKKKKESRDSASNTSTISSPRSPQPSPAQPSGPFEVLDSLRNKYLVEWLPLCEEYLAAPPADPKKREEEHRKLSESIMAQIILKLDAVETGGNEEIRNKRRAIVKEVEATLRQLDSAKAS